MILGDIDIFFADLESGFLSLITSIIGFIVILLILAIILFPEQKLIDFDKNLLPHEMDSEDG